MFVRGVKLHSAAIRLICSFGFVLLFTVEGCAVLGHVAACAGAAAVVPTFRRRLGSFHQGRPTAGLLQLSCFICFRTAACGCCPATMRASYLAPPAAALPHLRLAALAYIAVATKRPTSTQEFPVLGEKEGS